MSAPTFYLNCRNQGAKVTYDEVVKLREDWFKMWPEMNLYVQPQFDCVEDADVFSKKKKSCAALVDELGDDAECLTLEKLREDVQKKKINLYRAQNLAGIWKVRSTKQAALNFPFQSLAAVISKRALWLVYLDSQRCGYKLVNFIHR